MSLFDSIGVSASGMAAQKTRAELLVENLANAETTRTPEGGPYRRKDVVFVEDSGLNSFGSQFEAAIHSGSSGVAVGDVVVDNRDPDRRYMVDLIGASRSYEANVAAISAVKDMIQRSIDLFQ
jgi:flagellar basal-body rod protein FlgC